AQTVQELRPRPIKGEYVCISGDGKSIVSSILTRYDVPKKQPIFSSEIKVWDAETGQELHTLKKSNFLTRAVAVCVSGDGKRIVSSGNDRVIRVWDATTDQEILTLKGHTAQVWSVCLSRDGKRIVSASRDGTTRVWDATTGQLLLTLTGHGAVSFVCLS